MTQEARAPSDAILTIPNLLTFFRLALTPLFLWLALGPDNIGGAVTIAFVALGTDLVDGKIARRYGQISKLGIRLDPLSDRLGLASGAAVLIIHDLAPLWGVVAIVARDVLLVLVGAPLLKARGAPIPPVSRVGKYGSFAVSLCFGFYLLSGVRDVADPIDALAWIGFAFLLIGAPLYYVSGAGYVRSGLAALSEEK